MSTSDTLTPIQLRLLQGIALRGKTLAEVAVEMRTSEQYMKNQSKALRTKLGVENLAQAAVIAIQKKILDIGEYDTSNHSQQAATLRDLLRSGEAKSLKEAAVFMGVTMAEVAELFDQGLRNKLLWLDFGEERMMLRAA